MPNNPRPLTIREALQRASSFLSDAGITETAFIAEYLLRSYFDWDRTRFVTELQRPITASDWHGIVTWLQRAADKEPIQYIVGKQDFFGERFAVAPGVLIPRPETELLIEHVLRVGKHLMQTYPHLKVIDLGTGSGAIPITLAKQQPSWEVWALELSDTAITIARNNAEQLGVSESVRFVHGTMYAIRESLGDMLELTAPSFQIIVSNPPYIPSQDIASLQTEVRDHEPRMALDGGNDGLDFYRAIAAQVKGLITSPGLVAFEIGMGQGEEVAELLRNVGAKKTEIHLDFRGIDRVVLGHF